MSAIKIGLVCVVFGASTIVSAAADAQSRHRHDRGPRIGVYIGPPAVFGPWYYPPRYSFYHAYPPVVVVPSAPPIYVEQPRAPAPEPRVAQPQAYWYYCAESQTYYPYVDRCAEPWQRVLPHPPPS